MIEEVKESLLILHNTIHYITLIKSKETEIVNPPNIFPKKKKWNWVISYKETNEMSKAPKAST